jgi:hypothetical protein
MLLGITDNWRGSIPIGKPIERRLIPVSQGDPYPALPAVSVASAATVKRMEIRTNGSARAQLDSELMRSTARLKAMRIGDYTG